MKTFLTVFAITFLALSILFCFVAFIEHIKDKWPSLALAIFIISSISFLLAAIITLRSSY